MRLALLLLGVVLVTACDLNIGTTAPTPPKKCPPLDSALIKAQVDSFYPPWWCPLVSPIDSSKGKP